MKSDRGVPLEAIAKDLAQCLHNFRKWAYHTEDCDFEEIDEDEPCQCGSNKLNHDAHIAIGNYSDWVRKSKDPLKTSTLSPEELAELEKLEAAE